MLRSGRIAMVVAGALTTAGCASVEGLPQPVHMASIDSYYSLEQTRARIAVAPNEEAKRAERNAAAAMYIDAADREYIEFLVSLGVDRKSANLIVDGGVAILSSVGAVAKKGANEIAAAVSALNGIKGSVNREVFYEQTLPAIIGAMEANRLKVKTQIRTHLLQDSMAAYPLEQAWSDLQEYRMAQSLDKAILHITREAGQAAETQEDRYHNATHSCGPTSEVGHNWGLLNDFVYDLAGAAAGGPPAAGSDAATKLKALADVHELVTGTVVAEATSPVVATGQAAAITIAASKYCTKESSAKLLADIAAKTGMTL